MSDITNLQDKLDKTLETVTEKLKEIKNSQVEGEKLTDEKIAAAVAELKKENADYLEAVKKNNVSLGMEKNDIEKVSFGKILKGILCDDWKEAGYEKDILMQTKAQDTNTGAAGGYLIPTELAKERIIMPAIESMVMKAAGCDFWDGLVGDMEIPEATNRPTLTFGSDGVQATLQTVSFAMKPMRPKTGDMFAVISNKLLHQSAGFVEKKITQLMQEGTQVGLDEIALNGLGSESEPRGILQTSGTNTLDVSSARMTQNHVGAMIEDIQEQNFMKTGTPKLITRPKVIGGINRQLIQQYSGDTAGAPAGKYIQTEYLGTTSVAVSSNLTKAVMGEWAKFIIATWAGMRLRKSDQAGDSFRYNQTYLLMNVDVDTLCTQPLAFDIASNVSTNF